jgi:OmcA/MtrC family decaheme c-type cytochrome
MKFLTVTSAPVAPVPPATATTYNVTLTFTITSNGLPYVDAAGLPSMLQKTFYAVQYNSSTRQFLNSQALSASKVQPTATAGTYTLTQTGFTYDPTAAAAPFDGAEVYGYIAQNLLPVESYTPATHYQLYADLSSAALAFGTAQASSASAYVSNADVSACQGCHGTPYRKHGYREAIVGNGAAVPTAATEVVPTFAPCKACHYDNRVGSDNGWIQEVNDPLGWATGVAIQAGQYPYTANVMSDVHMSHAMEFAYPQSMGNCATCHPGSKLANVTADSFFQGATCTSCHPVADHSADKPIAYPTQANRAPSLTALWTASNTTFHAAMFTGTTTSTDCTFCHSAAAKIAPTFSTYHTGYNSAIYDATGAKYSSYTTATIDSVTFGTCTATSCVIDIKGSSHSTNPAFVTGIVPTVLVSLYGYDTKDFILDGDSDAANGGSLLTYTVGGPDTVNPCTPVAPATTCTAPPPVWTTVSFANGSWEVTADMAQFQPQATTTDTIPNMIAAGTVKKAEVLVLPTLTVAGQTLALNSPSQTVDLTNKGAFVSNYFQGTNAIVDINKCNSCHDALGTTFHAPDRGGNIVACRSCHVVTAGGHHLETQSRSIDSYVHAIHSFEQFNTGSINFTDPVAAKRYTSGIASTFPNFTTLNCGGCHVTSSFTSKSSTAAVTYEVPDQSQTLPGLLSASATLTHGWYAIDANGNPDLTATDRAISGVPAGMIPSYVAGPASRACGGCHRARLVNADDVNGLVSFNQHTASGGYLVDTTQASTTWTTATAYLYGVISNIMGFFK